MVKTLTVSGFIFSRFRIVISRFGKKQLVEIGSGLSFASWYLNISESYSLLLINWPGGIPNFYFKRQSMNSLDSMIKKQLANCKDGLILSSLRHAKCFEQKI